MDTPDYEKLRLYFHWVNVDTAQITIEQSNEWAVSIPNTFRMKRHLQSRNPVLNIHRIHEPVATDSIVSDTPAVDSGAKQAQVLVGRDTLVADAYPMKVGSTLWTPLRITYGGEKLWINSSVILPQLRYPTKSWIFLGHIPFQIGILSLTTRTKIFLNGGTGLSNPGPIQ